MGGQFRAEKGGQFAPETGGSDWCGKGGSISADSPAISVFGYDFAEIDDNIIRYCANGIYLEGPTETVIMNNKLRNDVGGENPEMGIGIALTQTGEGIRNLIRCNEWISIDPPPPSTAPLTLIRDGILVHGNNRTTLFFDNKFHCKYDTKIALYNPDDPNELNVKGELPTQSSGLPSNPTAVYNEFTDYSIGTHSAEIHTPNPNLSQTISFVYLHPSGVCHDPPTALGSQYIPRKPIAGTCSVPEMDSPFNFRNSRRNGLTQLTCPYIPRPIIVLDSECRTIPCLEDLYLDIAEYDSTLQGGDASTLYNAISTSPNGSSTLNALSNSSPWLSDGVMLEVLLSSMTETNKVNVLAANVPLSILVLGEAEVVLSSQRYNYLLGLHTDGLISARDSVQGNLISFTNYKNALLRHIVDSLMFIEEYDEAEDLLTTDGGRYAKESNVGLQIAKGDLTEAKELLSTWPTSERADEEFSTIHNIYLEFAMEGTPPSSVDSAKLMDIANTSPHQAARAKVLLGVLYGMLFDPLLPIEDENYAFSSPSIPIALDPTFDVSNSAFDLYPNPTGDILHLYIENVEAALKEKSIIVIGIYDTKGSKLHEQYVKAVDAAIDVSNLLQGIYIITAHTGKEHLGVKRFIKR